MVKTMAAVSVRNRIAAILLSSDAAMTSEQIFSVYPGRNKPSVRKIVGLLSAYAEFAEVGVVSVPRKSASGNTLTTKWTHIDHSLLKIREEE